MNVFIAFKGTHFFLFENGEMGLDCNGQSQCQYHVTSSVLPNLFQTLYVNIYMIIRQEYNAKIPEERNNQRS